MICNDNMENERKMMNDYSSIQIHEKRRKADDNSIIIDFLVIGGLFLIMFGAVYGFHRFLVREEFSKFTPERITRMEETYNISLSYAKPLKYYYTHFQDGSTETLELYTNDYRELMKSYYGESELDSSENEDGSYAVYHYTIDDKSYVNVKFEECDSKVWKYKGKFDLQKSLR